MKLYCAVVLLSPLGVLLTAPQGVLAAPQQVLGFGNASPDEIAQIRAGTYGDMFDDSPVYNYDYKVADTSAQNYMAMNENRDGDQVTGSYQYIDPYGSLIIVTYTAGPMGYSETREVREGAIEIKPQPTKRPSQNNQFSGSSGSTSSIGSVSGSSGSLSGSSGIVSSSGSSTLGSSSGSSSIGSSSFGSLSGSSTFGSSSGSSTLGSSSGTSNSGTSSSNTGSSLSSESSQININNLIASVLSQIQPLISGAVSSAFTNQEIPTTQVVIPTSSLPIITPPPATRNIPISNELVSQIVAEISPLVSSTVTTAVANSKTREASSFNQASGSRFQTQSGNSGFRRASNLKPVQNIPSAASSNTARSSATDITTLNGQNSQKTQKGGSLENIFGKPSQINVRVNTPYFRIEY